ncbi:unnamed protein product [Protopolystoma xenopodis]|uniref:Uncharacterized protein n=1 Tax=Protopolystoma xenopodis TaxID=117903 RepID=A0A448WQL2_9PLAT|nr:unnamed protein product [Protopolystoma xenopodis]
MLLEKCLNEIQRSFTHSCVRMESRLERVPANHCSEHSRPLSVVSPQSSPQPLLVVSSAAGGLSALVPHGPAPPGLPITGRPLSSGSQEPYFGSAQITGMRSSLNNGTSAVTAPGIEINEVVDAAGLPHRMNVAASIQPISSMSGVLELRPLPSSISNPASQNTSSEATRATTVNVPGPVGVCEKCVEQFKVHINELCKRAMHKVPVVLYKQQ